MATYNGVVILDVSWSSLKGFATLKNLAVQYEQSSSAYEIFCLDGNIGYKTVIFTGPVPNTVNFNQSTNDADKSDFETNYKDVITNRVITPSATVDGYSITTANPTLIAGSDGSNIRTLRSDISGRLITVGLGTAGTPAGGIISIQGVSGGQPIPISGSVTASNSSTGATGASPPSQATYIAGLTTTSAPSYTNNQLNALSLTTTGALRVDGSAVTQPVSGIVTANAGTGTFTVSGTVTANAGTGNFTVVQTTAANLRAQTGSEANTAAATGTVASLTGGAVTTTAPTYTTGQMNPLSLTTAGALRTDSSSTTQPVSGTVAATQSGTWTVQPGNTTNTTPWLVTANAGTGNFTVVQGTAANLRAQTSSESNTGAAPPAQAGLAGGSVTTAAPTYTTGQMSALSLTTAGALRIDGSGSTQPVSGTVTANAGTGTFVISAASLPLPTGAATETTLNTRLADATFTGRINTLGQKTMANSTPMVLASDQTVIPVSDNGTSLTVDNPALSVVGGGTEATAQRVTIASDSTGVLSVDDNGSSLTVDNTTLSVIGGGTEASALRVTIANNSTGLLSVDDNGGSLTVDGTVTANQGTPASLANAWSTKITDETNGPVAVKGASTIPLAADPALVVVLSPNQPAIPVTSAPTTSTPNLSVGDIVLNASNTTAAIRRTTYTEQTTNFTGSIASASANDTSAGTGARTVRIFWVNATGTTKGTEDVTLNGTTGVNLVTTTKCFIEKIEVLTAGSTGSNVGIISLYTGVNKTGTVVGTIAATNNTTFWAHHYILSGEVCNVTGIYHGNNSTVAGGNSVAVLREKDLSNPDNVERQVSDFVGVAGAANPFNRIYGSVIQVPGPARLAMYVTTSSSASITYRGSFDSYDV
jgi:hypothetical protein